MRSGERRMQPHEAAAHSRATCATEFWMNVGDGEPSAFVFFFFLGDMVSAYMCAAVCERINPDPLLLGGAARAVLVGWCCAAIHRAAGREPPGGCRYFKGDNRRRIPS